LLGASVLDELAGSVFKKKREEKVEGQTATLSREGAHTRRLASDFSITGEHNVL